MFYYGYVKICRIFCKIHKIYVYTIFSQKYHTPSQQYCNPSSLITLHQTNFQADFPTHLSNQQRTALPQNNYRIGRLIQFDSMRLGHRRFRPCYAEHEP